MFKIIVPIDFSSTSADALKFGCYLADTTGYDLEAVHVHDGYDGEDATVFMKGSARVRSRVRERLEKFVNLHADKMTFTGTHLNDDTLPFIKCREVVGKAISQLVIISKKEDTAMIVMGGVGSGIPNQATPVFGSVAKGVAMQAECPVLLIPQNTGVPKIERAAIAFDIVETLKELSDKTAFLRKALSPKMRFTHVLYQDDAREELIELDLLREVLKNDFPDYDVDFDLLPKGDVTNVLIDYALEEDIDMLILGRRPMSLIMNLLVKSEIPDIIGTCAIPILVAPLSK
ncbi:universal stress protein [Neolewinella agarilytica]|uniref:Nucleotide-binding universal stress protein, UspA family n=1 Tax=Neolewinella agarilytica TaxID=478744 RepID=A0A1H9KXN5_9BACT|nr:universal stress protein [Neolewinella agarilytica]SER03991.1 Nucleotide-binding universal stress protein, UspA family [Neolewinella agarilytica]